MTNAVLDIPVTRTIGDVRQHVAAARARGQRVALVPTMGALHDGHLSLIRQARAENECVVLSLFVNPAQFNDPRDLDAYPRAEAADVALAASAGCTLVFAPSVAEIYPAHFGTSIDVGAIAQPLEGEARGPVHFRGVATVVAKLFNIVAPDVAWFGQKDAQQVLVIRQLIRDLDFPVQLRVGATIREADGLAMSSRNVRLTPQARTQALGLIDALRAVEAAVRTGERRSAALVERAMTRLTAYGITSEAVDYFSIADAESLASVAHVDRSVLVSVAAHVGGVRLIDNLLVHP